MHEQTDALANRASAAWRRVEASDSEQVYVASLASEPLGDGTLSVTAVYVPDDPLSFIVELPSGPLSRGDLFEIAQTMFRVGAALDVLERFALPGTDVAAERE